MKSLRFWRHYVHSPSIGSHQLFLPLLFIFVTPFSSVGQPDCDSKLAHQLIDELTKGRTVAAIEIASQRYPNQRIYLLVFDRYPGPTILSSYSVKIYLENPKATISGSLPCVFVPQEAESSIESVHLQTPPGGGWQKYSVTNDNMQPGLRVVSLDISTQKTKVDYIVPPPRTPPPSPTNANWLVRPRIPLFIAKRKASVLTAFFAASTIGTYKWYHEEDSAVNDHNKNYQAAFLPEKAEEYRIKTAKAITRRETAQYVSIASGVIFGILLVYDFKSSKPIDDGASIEEETGRRFASHFQLKLGPVFSDQSLSLGVSMRF